MLVRPISTQLKTSLLALLMYVALNGAQYYPDFCELVSRHVLFFVTETKLDHTDVISVDGYIFESKPRQANDIRKSGGIGVFIKQSFAACF